MSTTVLTPVPALPDDAVSPAPPSVQGDQRIVFPGVSWEFYELVSEAQGEGNHVRLAYDGRDLELMTTSNLHEHLKELTGNFVKAVVSWRLIDCVSSGEATLNAKQAKRGLQADLSYCFDPDKMRMAREALARGSMDLGDYPKPDMAVEIDTSRSQIDRPSIFAALRVTELWRIRRDRTVIIEHLQPDGTYARVDRSRFLGVSADEIHGWLTAEDVGQESAWNRRLNQWAMGLGPLE